MKATFSTIIQLKAHRPGERTFEVRDTAVTGGYARVNRDGSLAYVFRYRFKNKPHKMFLGRFNLDAGGLAEARKRAREAANDLTAARSRTDGVDPVTARRQVKRAARAAEEAALVPPADLVERVVEDFLRLWARPHLKDARETKRILRKEVVSRWAGRRLSEISSAEVRAAIREIAERAPIGANRTLARFKRVCSWAVEQEIIATSPAATIKALTPEKGRERERVLSDEELAEVWRAADSLGFPFGPIYQLLILTGQRRGEVAGMTWGELNLDKALWTIPAERSKNGLQHTVALGRMPQWGE